MFRSFVVAGIAVVEGVAGSAGPVPGNYLFEIGRMVVRITHRNETVTVPVGWTVLRPRDSGEIPDQVA